MEFLDSKLLGLVQFVDGEYPNYIFWGKTKEDIYIKQDLKNNHFQIDYDNVWLVLELSLKFKLKYNDIQIIIKWHIETTYNLKGITTSINWLENTKIIETSYNLKAIISS